MSIKYKIFLAIFGMFLTITHVLADCIVTNNNFNKSSKIIFVNQYNGSDQLAKTYSLDNIRNPYEANNVAAFQSIEKAKLLADKRNGDLILIKTGRQWTNYEAWEGNKLSDFNKEVMKASGMSQRQCQGESLTWVPSAVNDNQPDQQPVTTDFVSNPDEVTLARTQETSPIRLPGITSSDTNDTTQSSSSSGRSSSSSSSSGGSSRGTNTNSSSNQRLEVSNQSLSDPSISTNVNGRARLNNTTSIKVENLTEKSDEQKISDLEQLTSDEVVESGEDIAPNYESISCEVNAPWRSAIQTYPQDSNGWSIITPDTETRIVYVSSTEGNDSLARPYLSAEVNDPFNPSGIRAYRTIKAAYSQLRNGKPDWILLKKGDTFELNDRIWLKSGKSQSAHLVFGAYGNVTDKRPIVDSGFSDVITGIKDRSFVTLTGIEFYASKRDPKSSNFVGWDVDTNSPKVFSNIAGNGIKGLHIENNRFNFYGLAVSISGVEGGIVQNIVFRRNEIMNSYSTAGHSQGLYMYLTDSVLVEENIFDHNGWYQQRPSNIPMNTKKYGYATYFNHNVYIGNSTNLIIQNNLSSRSSSIGMKFASNSDKNTNLDSINSYNMLLKNNVVVEGEVGFSIGGNRDFNNGYRWDNIQVINNVLTNIGRTKPTNRSLAFNIDVNDWQSGVVCGNTVTDNAANISNTYGLSVAGHSRDLTVKNNSFINLGIAQDKSVLDSAENITGSNNTYIAKIDNLNVLDLYVKSQGFSDYESYITSVLDKLKNNPATYYDVNKLIRDFNSSVANEKQIYQAKE
ncbi:MAG: hypothetical protein CMH22_11430 [Methylophaga sp.]|uniref:hypothetical protein n=1 Tax=Methylophaga sp. UBA678 TaxID=1946901 RepID=UPI000C393D22|nr:hypothetical protein [Methylophaga sp. UBA678]MAX52582.1 hypothetical protein [Methylophaga sp.]|tara:strand:- start:40487 stop:42868 length:2382 start_codon:yes stop_codon:yes gene_type:complete